MVSAQSDENDVGEINTCVHIWVCITAVLIVRTGLKLFKYEVIHICKVFWIVNVTNSIFVKMLQKEYFKNIKIFQRFTLPLEECIADTGMPVVWLSLQMSYSNSKLNDTNL